MSELAWIERGGGCWEARSGSQHFEIWEAGGRYTLDVNGREHSRHGWPARRTGRRTRCRPGAGGGTSG